MLELRQRHRITSEYEKQNVGLKYWHWDLHSIIQQQHGCHKKEYEVRQIVAIVSMGYMHGIYSNTFKTSSVEVWSNHQLPMWWSLSI